MNDDIDTTELLDEAWIATVRAALDDPMPADLTQRSIDLLDLADIDAELAELLAEEASDHELAGVRSTAQIVGFTFVTAEITIELELEGDVLNGQIIPGIAGTVELHLAGGGVRRVDTSVVGTFEVEGIGHGSHRLVVRNGGTAVSTPWFTL